MLLNLDLDGPEIEPPEDAELVCVRFVVPSIVLRRSNEPGIPPPCTSTIMLASFAVLGFP